MKYNKPREVALRIIGKVLDEGAFSNIETYKAINNLKYTELDKRFILEIVNGTIKHLNTLDWLLSSFVIRQLEKLDPLAKNILRMGTYQLLYMDRVPASAACNESVKLATKFGHRGIAKFVNGVLRNVARNYNNIGDVVFPDVNSKPIEHISIKYSHPKWLVGRWVNRYGIENTIKLCQFNNRPSKNSIRINTYKTTQKDFEMLLKSREISYFHSDIAPGCLIVKDYGLLESQRDLREFYITQSEPSVLVGHVANPLPGQMVLDACAAPGLKATHLAQLMKNEGKVFALDIHHHRVGLIKENSKRLSLSNIIASLLDARLAHNEINETFDIVLVDAPCSGTGVLNRRADARWRKTEKGIIGISRVQREILQSVLPLLKVGGSLVYSTCTLEPEENQEVIDFISKEHPELRAAKLDGRFLHETVLNGFNGSVQILPQRHNTEGFFIAKLIKGT